MVPLAFSTLNQQDDTKKSHKWLNYLPRGELDKELIWNKVYDEIIELAELLKDKMVEDT
jgi:hypothetical protein